MVSLTCPQVHIHVHGASWVLSLAQCVCFCHQGTTTTSMTLTTRVMRRRSGHTSVAWLSSHPSNWIRPLRYRSFSTLACFGLVGLSVPTLGLLFLLPCGLPGSSSDSVLAGPLGQ